MINFSVRWLLSAMLFLVQITPVSSTAIYAQTESRESGQSSETYEVAVQGLNQYMSLIEELRSNLDRSQVDSSALLDVLEYDKEEIISYVQNEIYFEQYAGTLRGAEGTIQSGSGNALDQSIILAKLLKDAGFDARIAKGKLSAEQAEKLLAGMTAARPKRLPFMDQKAAKATLQKLWDLAGQPQQELAVITNHFENSQDRSNLELSDETRQETEFILGQLRANSISLGDPTLIAQLVEETREYYWVEFRDGPSGEWASAHPAVGRTGLDLSSVSAEFTLADSIPADLQHRFRFEVLLETKIGGTKTRQLLQPWERPTANLIDTNLSFSIVPLSFINQIDQENLEIPERRNEVFVPVFMGQTGSNTFDLLGNVVPMDAAMSNYGALFATDAEKLSDAATSLGAMGGDPSETDQSSVRLSAVHLKFTFIEPGGAENEYWRTIYRRSDQAGQGEAPATLNIIEQLSANYSFKIAAGSMNPAAMLNTSLKNILGKHSMLQAFLARVFGVEPTKQRSGKHGVDFSWVGLNPTYAVFDSFQRMSGFHAYRHRPSLFIYRRTLPLNGVASMSTDVVQSQRRPRAVMELGSEASVSSMIHFGVWESTTEGALLPANDANTTNTRRIFERYRNSSLDFQVLEPSDVAMVEGLTITGHSKLALSRDLKRGYTVIVPNLKALPENEVLSWWRVDPGTGETLGISETGAGAAEGLKYTMFQRLVAGGVVGALVGITCDMARRNVARDTSLTASDCIVLGLGAGIGTAMGGNPIQGVPEGLAIAIGLLVLQKYLAPITDN